MNHFEEKINENVVDRDSFEQKPRQNCKNFKNVVRAELNPTWMTFDR
jgi:hypothetical protein